MVRVVHMNIFYKMDIQICDLKNEVLTKTENLDFQKTSKNSGLGPNIDFSGYFQDRNDF